MLRARALSFLLAALPCISSAAQQTVRTAITLQLPETGTTISIRYHPKSKADSETFRTLDFRTGSQTYRITSRYDLKYLAPHVDGAGLQPSDPIHGLVMDRARFFFAGHYTANAKSHILLFFIGDDGITCSPILAVGFHDDGSPYKVLELQHFCATSFSHPDGKSPSIVGPKYLSEVFSADSDAPHKPYATTYDPYSVYLFPLNAPAEYSLTESKLYNQQHYVWAGPESREDYAVVHNLPHHPKLFGVPASRLETILK